MREASKAKTTTKIEIKTTGTAAAKVEMANKARIERIAAEQATGASGDRNEPVPSFVS